MANSGSQFTQILQSDPRWQAYQRDPASVADSLGITDPQGYYRQHPRELDDLVAKRIIGSRLNAVGAPLQGQGAMDTAGLLEQIHVTDRNGSVSLPSDTGWLERMAPWLALAAAGGVAGAGALGAFGGGSGAGAGAGGAAADSVLPSTTIGTGMVGGLAPGVAPAANLAAGTTTAGLAGGLGAAAGSGAGSGLASSLTGGSGLASSILKLAAPALVAIAARPGGGSGNGPGGVPTGGPGGTPNYPSELQQLLAESMKRVASQGPLFDAATRQALAGLPDYAKRGG